MAVGIVVAVGAVALAEAVVGVGAAVVDEAVVGVGTRVGREVGVSAGFKGVDSVPQAIPKVKNSAARKKNHLMLPPAHMNLYLFSY